MYMPNFCHQSSTHFQHVLAPQLRQVRRDAVTWNSAADTVSRSSDGVQWALSLEWLGMKGCGMTMSGLDINYDILWYI